ncbi:MAG: DUF368 domain-containing protein [Candidatus Methanomethylophilaceae archaeon]|nr:DUF368 domain-containing protein [Candidatus Methanomethylophilaceae archaeon]
MKMAETLRNALIAAVIGIFMMMPGVSGATLAVIFGIYDRLIRDLSKPATYLKEDFWFIITIAAVGIAGAFVCIKGLNFLIEEYEIPLMFFFATAVSMQLPDIWKQAGDTEKLTSFNVLALAAGFALMILVLLLNTFSVGWEASSGPLAMAAAGVIYGVCLLSPGISGSTVLLALGLFSAVINALSELDLVSVAPLIAGAIIGGLLFAKVVDHFVTHNRKTTYFAIIGLTAGSAVTVVVQAFMKMDGGDYVLQSVAAIALGVALGWITHCLTKKILRASGIPGGSAIRINRVKGLRRSLRPQAPPAPPARSGSACLS